MRSVACSSTTRWTSSDARLEVMPDSSASSAGAAAGCVTCHAVPCFSTVVSSPAADFTVTRSILSDATPAKTFSCFFSSAGSRFES